MRGRKPTPPVLRALRGNPGKRPTTPALSRITSPPLSPEPPKELRAALGKEGATEWRRVVLAAPEGLLTELDRSIMAMYCGGWARWLDATRELAAGAQTVRTPSGIERPNPMYAIQAQALATLLKTAVELGFTPSARAHVTITVAEREALNPFAELMK